MRVAIFAVDPGSVTGIARGVFDTEGETLDEVVSCGVGLESFELTGDWRKQSEFIAREVDGWPADLAMDHEVGVVGRCELVIEDFEHRPGRALSGDPYLPLRVAARLEGLLVKRWVPDGVSVGPAAPHVIVYQRPGEKGVVKDGRLRDLGLWTRGSDHERDAWRHVVRRLMSYRVAHSVLEDSPPPARTLRKDGHRRVVRRRKRR